MAQKWALTSTGINILLNLYYTWNDSETGSQWHINRRLMSGRQFQNRVAYKAYQLTHLYYILTEASSIKEGKIHYWMCSCMEVIQMKFIHLWLITNCWKYTSCYFICTCKISIISANSRASTKWNWRVLNFSYHLRLYADIL